MLSRRDFLKYSGITAAAMGLPLKLGVKSADAFGVSMALQKFIDPMPLFGAQIPLGAKASVQPYTGVDYYQIQAGVFRQQLHSQLPATGTRLYGFSATADGVTRNFAHLGGAVLATKGTPVRFTFTSELPVQHILPYDASIPNFQTGSGGGRQDRSAVHLHGGLVPWPSDGGPFHWQANPNNTGGAQNGASVIPWLWDGTQNVWDYFYPNEQSARLMWYHDHAIAETRLNAYAGIATGYILQDANDNLTLGGGVLNLAPYNIPFLGQPIVFQDKVFWNPVSDPTYPTYVSGVQPGDLWYPWFYDPLIWPIAKGGIPPTPSAVPEFFGDTMLANGHVFPFHEVGVGDYRFRLLNACNARWLDLSFVQEDPLVPGEPLFGRAGAPVAANVDVWQIGTEGGFLPVPVQLVAAGVPLQPFLVGPAERADIIVRFNAPTLNTKIILYNVAGSPFPGGAPIFDWFVGNRNLPVQPVPGFGPNTRTVMQFRVVAAPANLPTTMTIPAAISVGSIPTSPAPGGGLQVNPINIVAGVYTDPFTGIAYAYDPIPVQLTLNEVVEPLGFAQGVGFTGRLLTLIGSVAGALLPPFGIGGIYYVEPPTEFVTYDTLRIWDVFNFTADAHPMHFHLFNVQVLLRQNANKNLGITGRGAVPLLNEMGFKETVTMYPGQVTRVAALVEDPLPAAKYPRDAAGRPQIPVTTAAGTVNSVVPFSPRLNAAYGLQADEYVWHCHILEHEEHDMMRPMVASY